MFQGSRNVGKAEHIALVQAAGGTMNGTTWLDRTNYFETMPSHQLELALWLEADRMGDAPRRPVAGEPRQPARGGQEREALVVRQPAVRQLVGEAPGPSLPAGASLPPPDDRLDGGPRRGVGRGRLGLLPDLLRPEQRRPVDRRRRRSGGRPGLDRALLRGDPGQPVDPAARRHEPAADPRRGAPRGRRGSGPAAPDLLRLPCAGRSATSGSTRSTSATQVLAGGKGSRLHRRLVRDERIAQDVVGFSLGFVAGASIWAGWATVRPGVPIERVETVVPRGARADRPGADLATTSSPAPRR